MTATARGECPRHQLSSGRTGGVVIAWVCERASRARAYRGLTGPPAEKT
jgi:hypothetical protein